MSHAARKDVWENTQQSKGALTVMLAIAEVASELGWAYPGIAYLMERTRLSRRAVQTSLRRCEAEKELLVFENQGVPTSTGYTNLYLITLSRGADFSPLDAPEKTRLHQGAQVSPKGAQILPEGAQVSDPDSLDSCELLLNKEFKRFQDLMSKQMTRATFDHLLGQAKPVTISDGILIFKPQPLAKEHIQHQWLNRMSETAKNYLDLQGVNIE